MISSHTKHSKQDHINAKHVQDWYTRVPHVRDTSFDLYVHLRLLVARACSATQLRYETKLQRRASDLRESSNGIFFYQGSS